MKSIKQNILNNRIKAQNENRERQLNEINIYKDKINDVYCYLYSIAKKIFEKQNTYIEQLDEFIESSTLANPKKVYKNDWIEESQKVSCDKHFKNIVDINRNMFYLYGKNWMAECKPLTDLIADLNLKFKDTAEIRYAKTTFKNDWMIVNVKAVRYSDQFDDYYYHKIKYKYTDKMKLKIVNHYQNEGLKIIEKDDEIYVTL